MHTNLLTTRVDVTKVRDISPQFLDQDGRLRVVPAADYAQTTTQERALFGNRHAIYGFLTHELVQFLQDLIQGRSAIEIGAGHGGLAAALGIPATDSHQQQRPEVAAVYYLAQQPVIKYGANVENLDAMQAIAKHKPKVVIGCWVTHKYDPARHAAGGNQDGIDEEAVIDACDNYIVVGNEKVHAGKSIWSRSHVKITPPWLYSRAHNGSPNFIAVWGRK